MQHLSSRLLPRNSTLPNDATFQPTQRFVSPIWKGRSHPIFRLLILRSCSRSGRRRLVIEKGGGENKARYTFLIKIFPSPFYRSFLRFLGGFRLSRKWETPRNQHTEIAIRICFFFSPPPPPQVLPEFWRRQSSFHENLLRRLTLT